MQTIRDLLSRDLYETDELVSLSLAYLIANGRGL
jgi:hypothetical protein